MTTSHNSISRRSFLAVSGLIPTLFLTQRSGGMAPARAASVQGRKIPVGIELYAVRGELRKDLPNTLGEVAKMGYQVVEFYSPYYDWSFQYAKEVRGMMDDLGLRCYSTHNRAESFNQGDTRSKAIELNQILGTRQIVMASAPGRTRTMEDWKKLCETLTAATEEFVGHGLTGGFHNHGAEWRALPGGDQRIMDVIASHTPKEFVLQLDVGTCVEAGQDPVAWIKAHPGRIKSVHLKDWAPGKREDEKSYRVLFGEGVSPWKEIVAALESVGGVEFYLMEQEGSRFSEFETARRCLANWKKLRE